MNLEQIYLEINHKPFEDGTPRHPLLTVELAQQAYEEARDLLLQTTSYSVGDFAYYIDLTPGVPEHNRVLEEIFNIHGIQGSIWVEYCLKVPKG